MYGQTTDIALVFQNSFGTVSIASPYFVPFVSEGFGVNKPPLVSANMRGVFDEGDYYEGPNDAGGDLEVEAQAIPLGAMLLAAIGQETVTNVGSAYQHVYTPRTSDWDNLSANPPVTIYKNPDTGSAWLMQDCVGNTLELSISAGELLTAKVGFVGGYIDSSSGFRSALAASYPAGKKWSWDATSISLGGSATGEISELTVTLENNMEAMHTLSGSKAPSRVKRTDFRKVSISGTIKFINTTEYQAFLDQSERELDVTFTGPVEVASGYKETLRIQAPLARHTEFKPAAGGPGEVEVSFTMAGVYSTSSATSFRITLVNTHPAY